MEIFWISCRTFSWPNFILLFEVAIKYPQESCKRKKRPVRVILYPSNQSPGNYYELVSLSSEEVVAWLRDMSFPDRYIQIFKKREICGLDLVCMDHLTLQHYGLPNVYVIRLMGYINHLIYHFSEENPGLSIPRMSDIFTYQNDEDDDTSWLVTFFEMKCECKEVFAVSFWHPKIQNSFIIFTSSKIFCISETFVNWIYS